MVNNRSQGEYNCVKISKFDLSKEGDITGLDLIIAQKIQLGYIIGGLDQMKDFDASVLDVNSDDRFNKADVDIVQKYILGIICK